MKNFIYFLLLLILPAIGQAQQKSVLPVNNFEKAIQAKTIQLVDVRTAQEFSEGHIKGAVNADWNNEAVFTAYAKKLDKTKPVYVYCLSGVRSGKAADWFAANGFSSVTNLEGGIKAWTAAGKPVVTQ